MNNLPVSTVFLRVRIFQLTSIKDSCLVKLPLPNGTWSLQALGVVHRNNIEITLSVEYIHRVI